MVAAGSAGLSGRAVVRVWVGPAPTEAVKRAVEAGGGVLSPIEKASVMVWQARTHDVSEFAGLVHDGVKWVQLDIAGIENWFTNGLVDNSRIWTCAKGQYSLAVAEHAVALILAACRRLKVHAQAESWTQTRGELLCGKTVGILGAGGIGQEVIRLLQPFGVQILALTQPGGPVAGADESLGPDQTDYLLEASDVVLVAAPLTPKTRGMIGAPQLDRIGPDGWLINVSRGGLVQTDALVGALTDGRIAGAYLDVIDAEPLPPGHPLWSLPNALITSHSANTLDTPSQMDAKHGAYARLVEENIRRYVEGKDLIGAVDPGAGY
jgi:phosphoglycerate dehydrogenase-like enzyme